MPFFPREILDFAECLLDANLNEHDQAQFRAVINRSYLAAVLEAEKILTPLIGAFPKDHEFYTEVENGLVQRNAPMSKDKLIDLRLRRKTADYDLESAIRHFDAEESLNVAGYLLDLMAREIK